MTDRIVTTPEDEARHAFDAANGAQPSRTIAASLAAKYGYSHVHPIVDDIQEAIEVALVFGEQRAEYVAKATGAQP